jgi:putative ABC transport system permease protein
MMVLLRDVRHGARTMIQRPMLAVVVVLTLGIGIGLNSAMFSLVDGMLLRPFPIPDIDRLAMLWESWPQLGSYREPVAPANFLDWKQQNDAFEHLLAYQVWGANLTVGDEPERAIAARVSPGFFRAFGSSPAEGRSFIPDEGEPGRDHSAVLSQALWSRRFAADPDLVGKTVLLDGERYTVVGIAAEGFEFPPGAELWVPLAFDPETAAKRNEWILSVVGRLKTGRTISEARAEMEVIGKRLAREHPKTNGGTGIHVLPLSEAVITDTRPFLLIWQAAVAFVLLIVCVNVANLLLARGLDRQKELALRMALGAGRLRIARLLMTENILLALLGAILALPLASIGIELIRSMMPANVARFVIGWDEIGIDGRLIAFTAVVAVMTSFVFGLLPAWQASNANLTEALKEGGRSSTDGLSHQRGRSALVVTEVATALMLLVACGLTIQGAVRIAEIDQGYDPDNLVTMDIMLPEVDYSEEARKQAFYESLLAGVRSLPEAVAADVINFLPAKGGGVSWPVEIEGRPLSLVDRPWVQYRVITPGYFETMRIPLIAGRHFEEQDRQGAPAVAIVSEAMARQIWPEEDPIGKRFWPGEDYDDPWMTVVGLSGDVIQHWFQGAQPTFYRPLAQAPEQRMSLVIRTRGEPSSIVPAVRAQLKRLDPNQSIYDVRSMRRTLADGILILRHGAVLMGVFGAAALVLSAVGIYGLMAYSVSRRIHEIGVRMVLGAARGDVLRLTVARALRLTAIGVGIGLLLALGAGQVMAATLFGTVSLDVATFAGFALILLVVALLAAYLPARRALHVDPAVALREE